MKLRGARKVRYDSGPNMIPLVDVVMVILIFLMLVGQFGGLEHYLLSKLPYSEQGLGGAKPPSGVIPDEPLDIRVEAPAPDRWVALVGGQAQLSDAASLAQHLSILHDRLHDAGTPTEKIQVIISPAKDIRYETLTTIYQCALQARFSKISFAKSH